MAACSRRGSRLAKRAFTVTTTKLMQNMMCAITTVQKPSGIRMFRNNANSDEPRTTSGVAMGRKINRLVVDRPRNRCRTSAKAISVPSSVAAAVPTAATTMELTTEPQTSGAPQGFSQLSRVKPCQTRLVRPALLNENTKVYATGSNR